VVQESKLGQKVVSSVLTKQLGDKGRWQITLALALKEFPYVLA